MNADKVQRSLEIAGCHAVPIRSALPRITLSKEKLVNAITLRVNGKERTTDVDPNTPLLWGVRDSLGLGGTKFGCGMALCGACTVLADGEPIRACSTPVSNIAGRNITTIEGLAKSPTQLHPLQEAWIEHDVPQCGYCQ